MNSIPGSEMTREPFRWDQRLFALVLRLAGTPAVERDTGLVPSDSSPIDAMCEVTGGRSYCITSHRMLNQCIDSLVQKVTLLLYIIKFIQTYIVIIRYKMELLLILKKLVLIHRRLMKNWKTIKMM